MNLPIDTEKRYVLRLSLLTIDKQTDNFIRIKFAEDFTEAELELLLSDQLNVENITNWMVQINSQIPQISLGNIKFPYPFLNQVSYLLYKYAKQKKLSPMYFDELFVTQYTKQYTMGIPHDTLSISFINNAPARIWEESLLYNL